MSLPLSADRDLEPVAGTVATPLGEPPTDAEIGDLLAPAGLRLVERVQQDVRLPPLPEYVSPASARPEHLPSTPPTPHSRCQRAGTRTAYGGSRSPKPSVARSTRPTKPLSAAAGTCSANAGWKSSWSPPRSTSTASTRPGSRSRAAARCRCADHLTAVLAGPAARVAAEVTAQAEREHLSASRREAVDACDRYLTGHLDQLRYDVALANGWPIATGAVEGACRHLIADRLDITGARWGLPGAEAVLRLRAGVSNGDLEPYWRFHTRHEHERIYPDSAPQQFALTA